MGEINKDMPILIVDDSRAMRRIVKRFLTNHDYNNLLEAADGASALAVMGKKDVQLIISDLNMPGMDGLALLKHIRENAADQNIPFIMLTVEAIQQTMNRAIELGVDSYIVKPVAEHVFMEEMVRVLGSKLK